MTQHNNTNDRKAQVQNYFSRTAQSYVTSQTHRTGADLQRLLELGEWSKDQRALDIATGGGHTALAVAPHVAQIMVTDLTPQMLEQARTFLLSQGITNAQFQVADAEALPFPADSFERVTCRMAPHHFADVAQAIQEVSRVLKDNGLFLLIDSIAPSDPELDHFDNTIEKMRDSSHGRAYTSEEWQQFFSQAGLHIEQSETFRRTHQYDDWTARAQLPADEKAALEKFILTSDPRIQHYFAVAVRADGQLESFSNDFVLLKGRKKSS